MYGVFNNLEGRQLAHHNKTVGSSPWSPIVLDEGLETLRGRRWDADTFSKIKVQPVFSMGEGNSRVGDQKLLKRRSHFA